MPINAPYNFVPLSKKVYFPDWADKISHDVPFKDGLSGTINLDITAKTALSIGGERDGNTVNFFQLPNGEYAIPGSSIRGMIRSVFEIATFSKMQLVDNKTFPLREFSGSHISKVYTSALTEEREVGYLQLLKGQHTITPCKYKKVSYTEYNNLVGIGLNNKKVREKYNLWNKLVGRKSKKELNEKFARLINNHNSFTPVFTGSINGKKHDYIFFDSEPSKTFQITDIDTNAWNDFLETHGDTETGETAAPMAWPSYWRDKYYRGERVPVFYKRSENRLRIGLTYMLKFAGDNRVKDLIENTSSKHNSDKMDLTEAVFGRALDSEKDDEKGKLSLKSRIQFGLALHTNGGNNQELKYFSAILASPKASYFPNYIKQSANPLRVGEQYATYLNYDEDKAEISGSKIYPVMNKEAPEDNEGKDSVKVELKTLPKGSKFKTTINFHNLRPMELGALLWSISIDNRLHTLGGGKPKQLGHTKIKITGLNIIPNDPNTNEKWGEDDLVICFKKQITTLTKSRWEDTIQIQTLLSAKTPKEKLKGLKFKGELINMALNGFSSKKTAGECLQPYITNKPLSQMCEEIKIVTTDSTWHKAKIHKVNNQLQITYKNQRANAPLDMIKFTLSRKKSKSLNNGTLYLDVTVESKGNNHIVKDIKPPQP